jgi:hypothetical protein
MPYVAPRRVTSTATTIGVNAAATSVLQQKAQSASAGFTAFHGHSTLDATDATLSSSAGGLNFAVAHPTSGILCDPTEDGASSAAHTAIDWGAKGVYDPTSRKVMWASCGAGNNFAGGKVYNTQPIYHETGANAGTWTVNRNFQSPNESNTNPIVHLYDGNAIDVAGRRFYRNKFPESLVMAYDLDAQAWVNGFAGAPEAGSYRTGALEFIPTRGSNGALWCYGMNSGFVPRVWEKLMPSGSWTEIISGIGASYSSVPMSYNPRALGGAGAVLLGGVSGSAAYIVNTTGTPAATATATAPTNNFGAPYNAHLCREPLGSGWLYFSNAGRLHRCTDGGVWSDIGPLPGKLAATNHSVPFIVVPIDDYGIVWVIAAGDSNGAATPRAWIYKP